MREQDLEELEAGLRDRCAEVLQRARAVGMNTAEVEGARDGLASAREAARRLRLAACGVLDRALDGAEGRLRPRLPERDAGALRQSLVDALEDRLMEATRAEIIAAVDQALAGLVLKTEVKSEVLVPVPEVPVEVFGALEADEDDELDELPFAEDEPAEAAPLAYVLPATADSVLVTSEYLTPPESGFAAPEYLAETEDGVFETSDYVADVSGSAIEAPFEVPEGGGSPLEAPFEVPEVGGSAIEAPFGLSESTESAIGTPEGSLETPEEAFGTPESPVEAADPGFGAPESPLETPEEAFGALEDPAEASDEVFGALEDVFETPEQAFGTPEAPAEALDEVFGALEDPLDTPEQAFGTPEAPAEALDEVFGAPEQASAASQVFGALESDAEVGVPAEPGFESFEVSAEVVEDEVFGAWFEESVENPLPIAVLPVLDPEPEADQDRTRGDWEPEPIELPAEPEEPMVVEPVGGWMEPPAEEVAEPVEPPPAPVANDDVSLLEVSDDQIVMLADLPELAEVEPPAPGVANLGLLETAALPALDLRRLLGDAPSDDPVDAAIRALLAGDSPSRPPRTHDEVIAAPAGATQDPDDWLEATGELTLQREDGGDRTEAFIPPEVPEEPRGEPVFETIDLDSLVPDPWGALELEAPDVSASGRIRVARPQRAPLAVSVGLEFNRQFSTGFSVDIGRGGLFVTTRHPPPVGALVSLFFEMPDGHSVAAQGEITWRRSGDTEVAGVGVRFTDLRYDDRVIVERYVNQHGGPR